MSNFDLEFTQIQIDMVAICLEYSRQNCDKIYIHVIHENSTTFVNYFFQANGEMVTKNQISSDDNLINTKRQQDTLSIILNDARKLFKLCNKY
ncbi:MAG: hypothetical protein J6B73_05645, partial [Methanobrevibacter sp.]|uniref:hypothetical protein n=1 Tax=Methanobrevibacter sp. TaxID=66852 RepID=UPI001B21850E